jgi:PKD repeat protein
VNFTINPSTVVCASSTTVTINSTSAGIPTWTFGNGSTFTGANPPAQTYNTPGIYPITGTISGACPSTLTRFVQLFGPITAVPVIAAPTCGNSCNGSSVQLTQVDGGDGTFTYSWSSGSNGTSISNQCPGNYTVTLVAVATPTCTDTTQLSIIINEPLSLAFTHNDSLCIIGNSFDFDATVSGPPFATYSWNFGTSATPNSSTQIDVNNVTYNQPGNHTIQLSGSFLNCVETVSSSIFIYDTIKIGFNVPPGPFCAPSNVVFTNTSTADVPLVYNWEFGNNNTSTLANPSTTYLYPGTYDVTLQIAATEGCTDTISLTQANAITIHPQPQAKFSIDISETDI